MTVKKKKILKYDSYFNFLKRGETYRLITRLSDTPNGIAKQIGFSKDLVPGVSILPSSEFGKVSLFNAEGKQVIRKDLPKETAHRTMEWHWKEWSGRYDSIERTRFVDVPYERYPRDFISPPSEEVEILLMSDEPIFASRILTNETSEEQGNLHVANLFLEIFGQFEIVTGELQNFHSPKLRKLNWQILPPGKYPWEKVAEILNKIVNTLPEGNRHWAEHRIEVIREHKPDFHAFGEGGFYGYVVYGFSTLGLYVLETIRYGNATYIFKENWESLSQLTKAQVIKNDTNVRRIIHTPSWSGEIEKLLKEEKL